MCMFMPRLSSLIALVPIAILLTAIFFVLFALRKIEEKWLKNFGYVVVSFLCLAILVIFSGAVYRMANGPVRTKYMMQQKMGGMHEKMKGMPRMMQSDKMPGKVMPGKNTVVKDGKKSAEPECGGNKGIIFKAK